MRRVQTAARLLLETLQAEFDDDLFAQWWEIFDNSSWCEVTTGCPAEQALWSKFNKLCRSRGWNEIMLARELVVVKDIAKKLFLQHPAGARESDGVSASGSGACEGRGLNKRCWADAMLEAEVAHGPLPGANKLYAWYKATCDSTCHVERLINIVKRHMKVKHADIGTSLLRDATTAVAFGPKTMASLATRRVCEDSRAVILEPTSFLQECNQIWITTFGRRYCVNKKPREDKDHPRAKKRAGTDIGVQRAANAKRQALGRNFEADSGHASLLPGLTLRDLAGSGATGSRTRRQKEIASKAHAKLGRLRRDRWVGHGAAGVSAAAPAQAKAKANAKPKAKAKPKANAKAAAKAHATARAKAKAKAAAEIAGHRALETAFYAHGFASASVPLLAGCRWVESARSADVVVVKSLAEVQQARDGDDMIPNPLLLAFFLGKRVATPEYCVAMHEAAGVSAAAPTSSIKFRSLLTRKFSVYFTPRFKEAHPNVMSFWQRSLRSVGDKCRVSELETEANARMVVNTVQEFHNFARKLVVVERERSERGSYRARV